MKIDNKLKTFFENQQDIDLVYHFGSSLTGKQHEESDLDIAILFSEQPGPDRILQLVEQLSDLFTREVDLGVLNNASPIFRMQVISKGKNIYFSNSKIKSNFDICTVNEYDDLSYYRHIQEKNILKGRLFA